jgi:hypothetical protein
MKPKTIVFAFVGIAGLISCKNNSAESKYSKLKKMDWLVGTWENKMPEGLLKETWAKENDSTYSGNAYFINPKDTVHFESIKLVQTGEDIHYIATATGQNNDEPVEFKLTSEIESTFIFENPAHDYPQKITYKKINDKSLVATISGNQQGKPSSESYPMTRK